CLELLRGKQALWRARPPILRTQSRSRRGSRQTGWHCASEFSRSISRKAVAQPSDDEWYAGTLASNDVMAITKWSVPFPGKGLGPGQPAHEAAYRRAGFIAPFQQKLIICRWPGRTTEDRTCLRP